MNSNSFALLIRYSIIIVTLSLAPASWSQDTPDAAIILLNQRLEMIIISVLLLIFVGLVMISVFSHLRRREVLALRDSDARYHNLINSMEEGLALHEIVYDGEGKAVNYRILDVNPMYERITGLSREAVIGKLATEVYRIDDPPYLDTYAAVAAAGESVRFETHFPPMEKWFHISVSSPAPGQFVTIFFDVNERVNIQQTLQQRETRYRTLFESSHDIISVIDEDGLLIDVNSKAEKALGVSRESIIGKSLADFSPPSQPDGAPSADKARALIAAAFGGDTQFFEWSHLRSDGTPLETEVLLKQIDIDGRRLLLAVTRDIDERKKSEKELRASEEKYRTLFSVVPDPLFLIDVENLRFIDMDEAAPSIYGYSREELLQLGPRDISAEPKKTLGAILSMRPGESRYIPLRCHKRKDGTIFPVEVSQHVFLLHGKKMMFALIRDISERIKAEEELREAMSNARDIVHGIPSGLFIYQFCQPDKLILLEGNPAARALTGMEVEKWVGMDFAEIWPTQHESGLKDKLLDVMRTGGAYITEDLYYEDTKIAGAYTIRAFRLPGERLAIGFENITERKQAEARANEERERLAVTLRSIGDGVITTDVEGRVTMVNRVAEQLTGWNQEEAVGRPMEEVLLLQNLHTRETCESPVQRVLRAGAIIGLPAETLLIAKDGAERIIADSGAPIRNTRSEMIGVVVVFRDITAEARLQADLQRTAKLESLGVLAGGIAHDFNNMLAAIAGNVTLAQLALDDQERLFHYLQTTERAAIRARDLTQQLLSFAKGNAPLTRVMPLGPMLIEMLRFVMTGSRHQYDCRISDGLWHAQVDEGQIGQMINNLVINAEQAMPERGTVELRAVNLQVTEGGELPLPPGPYVRISIIDQGIGIPPEHMPKIYDPFFSTKQRGSGLGLSSAYTIVKAHGGYMDVESTLGKGTTFHIYLPAITDVIDSPATSALVRGAEKARILVLDDEALIREMLIELLTTLGHDCAVAADGEEAISAYTLAYEVGCPFDLLILDLTIPGGLGGKDVIAQLKQKYPGVRAIASSGYSTDPIMADYTAYGFIDRLAKPYRLEELQNAIQRSLANEELEARS